MVSFKSALASAFNSALKVLGMAPSLHSYAEVTQLNADVSLSASINGYYNFLLGEYNQSGTARMHDLIVTLAQAVNHAEEQYLLVDGQCYYYTGSIISALRDVSVDTSDYKPYGNYKLLTIYFENKLKVIKLIEQYSEAKAAFETKVSDIEQAKLGTL